MVVLGDDRCLDPDVFDLGIVYGCPAMVRDSYIERQSGGWFADICLFPQGTKKSRAESKRLDRDLYLPLVAAVRHSGDRKKRVLRHDQLPIGKG